MPRVAVVGAGAAGCFLSVLLGRNGLDVTLFEAGPRPMAKLARTGGGRCNLTNSFDSVGERLGLAYPRGEQLMRRAFSVFDARQTMEWWENEGVRLVVQEDGCVFPESQDASEIVDTLYRGLRRAGVELRCGSPVDRISALLEDYDAVVLTAGGKDSSVLSSMLEGLDVAVTPTVPSLFTLKLSDGGIRSLMGAVVPGAVLSLAGTSFSSRGPLLITDWGVSGPATLKLSSYAARYLAEHGYSSTLVVNWLGLDETGVAGCLESLLSGGKLLSNTHPSDLSARVWRHILGRAGVREDMFCRELGSKGLRRLVSTLTADSYEITGRARFKEEFVTCGGVDLHSVNIRTLESRNVPGLYFAGEVLDVDAITGGFNLQAAWSTAMYVSKALCGRFSRQ